MMDVYKNSLGLFVCRSCGKSFDVLQLAVDCASSHKANPVDSAINANTTIPATDDEARGSLVERNRLSVMASGPAATRVAAYHDDFNGSGGSVDVAKRLVLSLLEDYEISRQRDFKDKGFVGPLSMNMGKVASESLGNLNKLIVGERSSSVRVNVDARKSDIDALREVVGLKSSRVVDIDE
jgi:hypothetical protein